MSTLSWQVGAYCKVLPICYSGSEIMAILSEAHISHNGEGVVKAKITAPCFSKRIYQKLQAFSHMRINYKHVDISMWNHVRFHMYEFIYI